MNEKQDQPKESSGGGVFTGSQKTKKCTDWMSVAVIGIILAVAAAIVILSL